MTELYRLLILLLPIIVAGVLNMVWVKTPYLPQWAVPMDRGQRWRDGKRLFGDNKTWKGFWGMAVLTALTLLAYQQVLSVSPRLQDMNLLVLRTSAPALEAMLIGFVFGLAYVVFELPNSFIKRRLDIGAGQNASGKTGMVFTVVDQADSVIGCAVLCPLFTTIGLVDVAVIIVLGTSLHLVINALLFVVGLKKQPR